MWLFEKGAFGVVLVVMSLAASLLFGVVINVNSETVQKDVPEYVSDIRGLYEGESDQTYVDYNPAANFNGYVLGDTEFTYPNSGTRSIQNISPHSEGATYIDGTKLPQYHVVIGGVDTAVYTCDLFNLYTNEPTTLYHNSGSVTATSFGPFLRTSATTWMWGTITLDADQFRCIGTGNTIYSIETKQVTEWNNATSGIYSLPQNSVVKITNNNSVTYIPISSAMTMTVTYVDTYIRDVTIGSSTYRCTTLGVATPDTTVSYERTFIGDSTVNTGWFSYNTSVLSLSSYTMSDIVSIINNAEANDGVVYGNVMLRGVVTASDGVNSYICSSADPFIFLRSSNGWEGSIGDMADFTFTNASDTRLELVSYNQREFTGSYDVDFTILNPMGFRVSYGGSGWHAADQTVEYYYAEPVSGHITFSTVGGNLVINGTTYLQNVTYLNVEFVISVFDNTAPDYPYRYDYTQYTTSTAALNDFTVSTLGRNVLNQHIISYGNGIPDDQPYGFYKIVASENATLRDESGSMSGRTFGAYYAYSDTTWKWASRTASTAQFSVTGDEDTAYTVTSIGFTQIVIPYEYDMTVPAGNTVIKIASGGSNTYLHITAAFHIIYNGTTYTVNGNAYSSVDAIYISTFDPATLTYTATIRDFPVDFKSTPLANNYKFSYEESSEVSREVNIAVYPHESVYSSPQIVYEYEDDNVPIASIGETQYKGEFSGWKAYYNKINLKTAIDQEIERMNRTAPQSSTVILDFPMNVIKTSKGIDINDPVSHTGTWYLNYAIVDNPIIIADDFQTLDPSQPVPPGGWRPYIGNEDPYTSTTLFTYNNGDVIHLSCEYNVTTKITSIKYGNLTIDTLSYTELSDKYIFYPSASIGGATDPPEIIEEMKVFRYYDLGESPATGWYLHTEDYIRVNCTNAMNVIYTSPITSAYLDARFGVNVRNGEVVSWQNGYSNEILEYVALLGTKDSSGNVFPDLGKNYNTTWEFTYGPSAPSETAIASRSSIQMIHQANGPTTFYFDNYGSGGASYEFGSSWAGFVINVNGVTGKISIRPITSANWTSFLVNTPDPAISMTYTLRNKGEITGMLISVPGDMTGGSYIYEPVRFQVNNTSVFLNTYGVIKVDAVLDILKYYPLNEKFMVSIHDTAAVGSSITIAGQTYEIEDNRIRVPVSSTAGHYVTLDVTEMEIKFYKQNNGLYDMNISSAKTKTDVDLTNVSDTTIGLEGAWYFESDYYVIELKDVQEYQWDVNNLAYGYSGIVLFMMIFLGILGILFWKFLPDMVGAIDIAIIIGAEIILFIILV